MLALGLILSLLLLLPSSLLLLLPSSLLLLLLWCLAQLWLDLALVYASQQQPEDATKCVQQLRLLDPDSAATFHAMGAVAASQGNDVAAKANYKAALARDAAFAPALLSLGGTSVKEVGAWWHC